MNMLLINWLSKLVMGDLVCFAIFAFFFFPVFQLKWCALYVFVFALAFYIRRWSWDNVPRYYKDPWTDDRDKHFL